MQAISTQELVGSPDLDAGLTILPIPPDTPPADQNLSIRDVRRNCLECCGDNAKTVAWCTCDGHNSTRCQFWPFRFGVQPSTFRQRYGPRLLSPMLMPPDVVDLDSLPAALTEASTAAIDVPGYRQPAVEVIPTRPKWQMSPERRQAAIENLARGRKQAREARKRGTAAVENLKRPR